GGGELDLPLVVELLPLDLSRRGEFVENRIEQRGIEEVVENDVRERYGACVTLTRRGGDFLHPGAWQKEIETHPANGFHGIHIVPHRFIFAPFRRDSKPNFSYGGAARNSSRSKPRNRVRER